MHGNPFDTPLAIKNSSLHLAEEGRLVAFDSAATANNDFLCRAHALFRENVFRPGFSCIGAKAAFNDEAYGFATYTELASEAATAGLCRDLCHFTQSSVITKHEYATFIAVFCAPCGVDERTFEQLLWRQLDRLHSSDKAHFSWDASVSADPADPEFSFSFAGRAYYVVGMHENSSRRARKFSWPTLVFNPHEQFKRLRKDGQWKRMQKTIRAREMVRQGSVNPMLSDFGEKSEARQYSGRVVSENWEPPTGKCPFGH